MLDLVACDYVAQADEASSVIVNNAEPVEGRSNESEVVENQPEPAGDGKAAVTPRASYL